MNALLVMAKRPSPGHTKTRLAPLFEGTAATVTATALYACFLRDTLALVRSVPGVTPFIAFTPPDAETAAYFHDLAPDFELIAQTGRTLGERLSVVLTACLYNGYTKVIAVSSDSPTLPVEFLSQGFARLKDPATDVVLGPCRDGGYYLIGWKRPHPRLVLEVQMSTDHVLADTLAIAREEGLRVALLPDWYDVDKIADLGRLWDDLQANSGVAPHTSAFLRQNLWSLSPHIHAA